MDRREVAGYCGRAFFAAGPILLCLLILAYCALRSQQKVVGRLKRAADANTPVLALRELEAALATSKKWGWDKGSTHLLWSTPAHDVEFWWENLEASAQELRELPSAATPLERSNLLLKLRETILDDTGGGVVVTAPPGLALHPYRRLFSCLFLASLVWGLGAGWWFMTEKD